MPTNDEMKHDFMGLVAKASRHVAHGSTEREDAAICWAGNALVKLSAASEQHEKRAEQLLSLVAAIHEKLENGCVFGWDDGDPCWTQMRREIEG